MTAIYVFAFTQTACTQQKTESNPDIKHAKPALATSNDQVDAVSSKPSTAFAIAGVGAATPNKIVDIMFTKDGKQESLINYTKGKYVFLNFWGTWCPPCRAEIPHIVEIQEELGEELMVVGVAMERAKEPDAAMKTVAAFSEANKMNYTNIILNFGNELHPKLAEAYGGLQYVPTTFLIDKQGNVFEVIQGGRSKEQFMESINKMMKKIK